MLSKTFFATSTILYESHQARKKGFTWKVNEMCQVQRFQQHHPILPKAAKDYTDSYNKLKIYQLFLYYNSIGCSAEIYHIPKQ